MSDSSDYEVEIYTDVAGEHRWRLVASNGRIVAASGEGYRHRTDCADIVEKIFTPGAVTLRLDAEVDVE